MLKAVLRALRSRISNHKKLPSLPTICKIVVKFKYHYKVRDKRTSEKQYKTVSRGEIEKFRKCFRNKKIMSLRRVSGVFRLTVYKVRKVLTVLKMKAFKPRYRHVLTSKNKLKSITVFTQFLNKKQSRGSLINFFGLMRHGLMLRVSYTKA